MSAEQVQLLIVRGAVASMEDEERSKVMAAYEIIKVAIAAAGPHGAVALALLGAELAAED